MPRDKSGSSRKVLMLPDELLERVAAFQASQRLPSEVEAIRRILEAGLAASDTYLDIAIRVRRRLAETGNLTDAARDIVFGHPSVTAMSFADAAITFSVKSGEEVKIQNDGETVFYDSKGKEIRTVAALSEAKPGTAAAAGEIF